MNKKRFLYFTLSFIFVLLLIACGSDNEASKEKEIDRKHKKETTISLSKALEKNAIWFATDRNPTSDSNIYRIYFFDKGTVSYYDLVDSFTIETITMGEVANMSKKEIVQFLESNSVEMLLDEYVLDLQLDESGNETEHIKVIGNYASFDEIITVYNEPEEVTISDKTFQGFISENIYFPDGNGTLLTRVNESASDIVLDPPTSKHKLVTVEEYSDIITDKKESEEERREEENKKKKTAESEFDENDAEQRYKMSCAACHGHDLEGAVGPSLKQIGATYSAEEILDIIENGIGTMPAGLASGDEAAEIATWLSTLE